MTRVGPGLLNFCLLCAPKVTHYAQYYAYNNYIANNNIFTD